MKAETSALANPRSVAVHGRARFSFLTDRFVRMEWAEDGRFEDRQSLAVANRNLPSVRYSKERRGDRLILKTAALTLKYRDTDTGFSAGDLSCTFSAGGVEGRWRFGQEDKRNLGGTFRTLDGFNGDCRKERKQDKDGKWVTTDNWVPVPLPPGLVSRAGWSVFDDTGRIVLDTAAGAGKPWVVARPTGRRQDLYFMAYGQDYRKWVHDASLVFGRQPLPPRFALGYWYSRYWAYTDKEIEGLVKTFDSMGVPLDVMVIDMDWHKPGWTGYSWDRDYFPDPEETLRWLKAQNLKVSLNLHPADGVGDNEDMFDEMFKALGRDRKWLDTKPLYSRQNVLVNRRRIRMDMTDPKYVRAYFNVLHHPMEKKGVDVWWMDWQQGSKTRIEGLDPLPWINHLHWTDMAENPARRGRRPICFSRYGGVGAGRYPVGFSGDTLVTWKSLAFQPRFTATAANVLYGWWSHDIGGHYGGEPSAELYTRWVQYGIYSPIFRTHCTKSIEQDRRFWAYQDPYRSLMTDAVRRRYEMIPYVYTEGRRCFDTGLSIARPVYYHHPSEAVAYKCPDEYYFGESLLVAPVIRPLNPKTESARVDVWLPEGRWFETGTGRWYEGGESYRLDATLEETPVFVRAGAIVPGQRVSLRAGRGSYRELVITCYPGGDGAYDLYEDDGETLDYQANGHATIPFEQEVTRQGRKIVIGPCEGKFNGFLRRRPVELRLPGIVAAKSVRVDGKLLKWSYRPAANCWCYDGNSATVIITLGKVDLAKRTVVVVEESRGEIAKAIDGFPGMMRRLGKVMDYAKLVSPWFVMHAEERLAVKVGQMGNRISRNPESLKAELETLPRLLKRLPKAIDEFRRIYIKNGNPKNAEFLAKALRVLRATMRK